MSSLTLMLHEWFHCVEQSVGTVISAYQPHKVLSLRRNSFSFSGAVICLAWTSEGLYLPGKFVLHFRSFCLFVWWLVPIQIHTHQSIHCLRDGKCLPQYVRLVVGQHPMYLLGHLWWSDHCVGVCVIPSNHRWLIDSVLSVETRSRRIYAHCACI